VADMVNEVEPASVPESAAEAITVPGAR